ncbi:MAG TPA: IspD/TarI family cytidylyltransferase [Chlamydiales bacterium]|nr:IspD/TarI family cytidylyltransferase [Chlamydiales bacterium]
MFDGKRIGAVLLLGGEGLRFGNSTPKQFHMLGEKRVFQHALDTLVEVGLFDEIVAVCHKDWMHLVAGRAVPGGKTRQASVYCGLKGFERDVDVVLVHDGVRPFVSERIVRDNVVGAIEWGAVDTCVPSADTIVQVSEGQIAAIPKREGFWRGQTPQTFRTDWIVEAHERAIRDGVVNASDDCQLVLRMGRGVRIVMGDERNIKITSECDLAIAQHLYFSATLKK